MIRFLPLLLLLVLSACETETDPEPTVVELAPTDAPDHLTVRDAYATAAPVGGTGGVFLTIAGGPEDDVLLSAISDLAARVELHETYETEDGLKGMRPVEAGIPIPAGTLVSLEPGGHHIMLMGLLENLADGDTLDMDLEFAQAGIQRFKVLVRGLDGMPRDDTADRTSEEGE